MLAGMSSDISQQVLRTDVAGMPLEWIDYREAVRLYHANQVAYQTGTLLYTVFGGFRSYDGCRSKIDVNSIIATRGTSQGLSRNRDKYVPPLNNRTLFKRDANLCLYCSMRYPTRDLTAITLRQSHRVAAISGTMLPPHADVAITTKAGAPRNKRQCNSLPCHLRQRMPSIFTSKDVAFLPTR